MSISTDQRLLTTELEDRCREALRLDGIAFLGTSDKDRDWYTAFVRRHLPEATVVYAAWGHVELVHEGLLWAVDSHSDRASVVVLLAEVLSAPPPELSALATLLLAGGFARVTARGEM